MDSTPTTITFQSGWDELQTITSRLDEGVAVEETIELLARGRGLERTLRDYLTSCKARIEEIERGEGLREFVISTLAEPPSAAGTPASITVGTAADDDIPF